MSKDTVIPSLHQQIDDLNQQAWENRVNDFQKALELSRQTVKLAREIDYPRGLAEGLRSLGFAHIRLFKNDEAAAFLRESLSLFQSLNDQKGQAIVYEYLGIVERNWGNLGASLELLLKGNDLISPSGSPEAEITSCYQIGVTYKHLGDHENALEYLYRSLSLAQKVDMSLMVAYATNIIGSIYFDDGNYEKALELYQQGLVIRRDCNDKWGEAGSLDNIGFTYLKLKDLDKAIDHCRQSLVISRSTGDKKGEANALLHLAEIYEQAGDSRNAVKFSTESLEIRKARGDKRGEAEVLLFLASLYKSRHDIEEQQVFEWLSGALKIADEIKAQDLLSKAFYDLHEYYSLKGDFKRALAHLESHLHIEKELHKNTINQKVSNLEISRKAEAISQRNKELTDLNEQIKTANAELKIGSSLERVRTAAMAMKTPADMLDVCKIISQELTALGVNEIRNVQTAIFYEQKGSYMNFEYYAKHDQLIITEVEYKNHPVAEAFADQMLKGANRVWMHEFRAQQVREWLDYQRTTNVFIDTHLEAADSLNYYWYSLGPVALGCSTYAPLNEKEIDLFKRFRNVFELAYRRYTDIEKAEAQAREANIEAALERVRAASLAMHQSDDLINVINVVKQQLIQLGFHFHGANFVTDYSDQGYNMWLAAPNESFPTKIFVPQMHQNLFRKVAEAVEKGLDFTTYTLSFEEKNHYFENLFANSLAGNISEAGKKLIFESKGMSASVVLLNKIRLNLMNLDLIPYTDEENNILKRIAYVFEQSYIRFLDLKKAEAQAREAQIEAALERIRSRTMGMQRSDELPEAASLLFQQIESLGIQVFGTGYNIWNDDRKSVTSWMSSQGTIQPSFELPLTEEPSFVECYEAAQRGDTLFVQELSGDKLLSHLDYLRSLPVIGNLMTRMHEAGIPLPGSMIDHHAFFAQGYLLFITYEPVPGAHGIFKRFAKVFEQTYTRFLDLQKAEAQAREAQIEAALEKVRSRSLAMHRSDEIEGVLHALFERLKELNIDFYTAIIILFIKDSKDIIWWLESKANQLYPKILIPYTNIDYLNDLIQARENEIALFSKSYSFDEKNRLFHHLFNHTDFQYVPEEQKKFLLATELATFSVAIAKNTAIHLTTYSRSSFSEQDNEILERFANVFEQAYTRFLDLQKAETQAREAQIEVALEKVRAKVMAMGRSQDLNETSLVFGEQLRRLGIEWQFSYFWLIEEENNENTFWITWPDNRTSITIYTLEEAEQYFNECLVSWRAGIRIHDSYVQPADVKAWLDKFQRIADDAGGVAREIMKEKTFANGVYYYDAMMKYGSLGICINQAATDEEKNIQSRFAIEFERAYTRFLDLKKAESQTREALIEGALERVRARALAMQQPEELRDVAQVLRTEMGLLGIEELETCSIYIHEKDSDTAECWYALKDTKEEAKKMVTDHFQLSLHDTWVGREMKKFYSSDDKQTSIVMQGANRKEWVDYCYQHSPAFSGFYGETISDRTYHLYKFSHGYIGAAALGEISNESWKLLGRAASVFSLAYSRFRDLTQARDDLIKLKEEKKRAEDALTELQNTQRQLVQSEKMASLGELTAGIAHEIQNPLNFVNNFSDVSNELLEEMKAELTTGNTQSAIDIVNDVKDNLEKILHHGKRADAIVKSMLQHSRSSSGKKEPTDINALADEYFRLAFHGLRAKDKSFNAKFETDFDNSIGKIDIVPQEMGRVILNLINNAFYAVNEKKRTAGNGYEPAVIVTTRKDKAKVEIKVKDNGNGIPQRALDKIFQPFFTTKPTGQGTGLGLSLSYDIVTKGHGGDITVKTREGEGAEFTISLPVI